jgi:hypothetical protein
MPDPAEPAIAALTGSTTETVGTFRHDLDGDTWWWSPGVYAIHGYQPGQIVPTTALMTAHQHPDDRTGAARLLAAAVHAGQPFCSRHRIVDARQRVHTVITLGQGRSNGEGRISQLHGYLIDVTDALRRDLTEATGQAVHNAVGTRAAIEQAKGALMITHGLDQDEAFALLRQLSQHHNIKLRDIAATITDRSTDPDLADLPATTRINHILTDLTHPEQPVEPSIRPDQPDPQTDERISA